MASCRVLKSRCSHASNIHRLFWAEFLSSCKRKQRDLPGGTVAKNPPASAGDTGSSPGPGRSHLPWSK